jgi:hypothetical protein
MQIRLGNLKSLIRESIRETTVSLSDGSVVEFGSNEHIADMSSILAGLENLKRQHKYATAARAKFADASMQLKKLIKRASKNKESDSEQQDFVVKSEMSPGRTGYGRGAMGAGQYNPGFDRRL